MLRAVPVMMNDREMCDVSQNPGQVSDNVDIKRETADECTLAVDDGTLVKQEPLEADYTKACHNVYNSLFNVVKNEFRTDREIEQGRDPHVNVPPTLTSYSCQSRASRYMNTINKSSQAAASGSADPAPIPGTSYPVKIETDNTEFYVTIDEKQLFANSVVKQESSFYKNNTEDIQCACSPSNVGLEATSEALMKRKVLVQGQEESLLITRAATYFLDSDSLDTDKQRLKQEKHPTAKTNDIKQSTSSYDAENYVKRNKVCAYSRTRTGEKKFKCEVCPYKGAHKCHLNNHMKTHTGERPYACDLCPYKSAVKCNLVHHMRIHSGEKPYKCNLCPYKCAYKSSLDTHMRTHSGDKPFKCTFCPYRAAQRTNLDCHIITHTGTKLYDCDICPFKTNRKDNLKAHMRLHSGLKPFKCNSCSYTCARKDYLKYHMMKHTGETFGCDLCPYKTIIKSNLIAHLKRHGEGKSYKCS